MAQRFNSIQHRRIADTLYTHDEWSNEEIESIEEGILKDSCEFTFRDGTSPIPYLQKRRNAIDKVMKFYEEQET